MFGKSKRELKLRLETGFIEEYIQNHWHILDMIRVKTFINDILKSRIKEKFDEGKLTEVENTHFELCELLHKSYEELPQKIANKIEELVYRHYEP